MHPYIIQRLESSVGYITDCGARDQWFKSKSGHDQHPLWAIDSALCYCLVKRIISTQIIPLIYMYGMSKKQNKKKKTQLSDQYLM